MQLFIKNVRGTALSVDFDPSATVSQLLQEIRAEEALRDEDISKAKLVFKGKELDMNKTLQESAVEDCSVITIAIKPE